VIGLAQKDVRVHPYFINFKLENYPPDFWRENFKRENVQDNLVRYGDNFLVIVVNKVSGNKVFGKILKLRTDRPTKINRTTGKESEISLLEDENIV